MATLYLERKKHYPYNHALLVMYTPVLVMKNEFNICLNVKYTDTATSIVDKEVNSCILINTNPTGFEKIIILFMLFILIVTK